MTRSFFVAVLIVAITAVAACGGPAKYRVRVDNPMVPFKPADPDDLVVETDDEDEEAGAAKGGADEV